MPNKRDRITIAGTVYHQISGSNPTSISLRCTQHTLSSEQVYARSPPKGVGPGWEPLNLGWVEKCSLLCIKNQEAVDPKNTEEWKSKMLLLGWTEDYPAPIILLIPFGVPPGMVSLLYPTEEAKFLIKSGGAESVKYTLFALPG